MGIDHPGAGGVISVNQIIARRQRLCERTPAGLGATGLAVGRKMVAA